MLGKPPESDRRAPGVIKAYSACTRASWKPVLCTNFSTAMGKVMTRERVTLLRHGILTRLTSTEGIWPEVNRANKRVFHLVYNRAVHAGGSGEDSLDHLKNQVLELARDLRRLTEEFAHNVDPNCRNGVRYALHEGLREAELAADFYGIANPL